MSAFPMKYDILVLGTFTIFEPLKSMYVTYVSYKIWKYNKYLWNHHPRARTFSMKYIHLHAPSSGPTSVTQLQLVFISAALRKGNLRAAGLELTKVLGSWGEDARGEVMWCIRRVVQTHPPPPLYLYCLAQLPRTELRSVQLMLYLMFWSKLGLAVRLTASSPFTTLFLWENTFPIIIK